MTVNILPKPKNGKTWSQEELEDIGILTHRVEGSSEKAQPQAVKTNSVPRHQLWCSKHECFVTVCGCEG